MKTKLAIVAAAVLLSASFTFALPSTNMATRAAIISWDASPSTNITTYNIYCSTNSFWSGTNMVLNPSLVSQWQVSGSTNQFVTTSILKAGTKYYFVVTASSGAYESDYSEEASIVVTPRVLPPSLHTTIQLVGSSTPVGPWDPIDLLAEYLITPDCDYAFYRAVVDIHR